MSDGELALEILRAMVRAPDLGFGYVAEEVGIFEVHIEPTDEQISLLKRLRAEARSAPDQGGDT